MQKICFGLNKLLGIGGFKMATHPDGPEENLETIKERSSRYRETWYDFSGADIKYLLDVIAEKDLEIARLKGLLNSRFGKLGTI